MNRRSRIDGCRNLVRPDFDQLDARLLLSVTAAGSGASNAPTTVSGPVLTAAPGTAALPAPRRRLCPFRSKAIPSQLWPRARSR